MDNFVRLYDDVFDADTCSHLIDKFEAHPEMYFTQDNANGATLTVIHMMGHDAEGKQPFVEDVNPLSKVLSENVERYKKDCRLKSFQFPKEFGFEPFVIKRYLPDTTEEFPSHIDVSGIEYVKRFLVIFVYLTDNYAGQTELEVLAGSSPCRRGSILIFPPYWPWVHAGKVPVKNPKYILGTYCQYV